MTGKLADTVMSVRNGEQIARKYQPVVSNPNTPAQVEARAKLKLMSQISAVVSSAIAFHREGSVSPRNIFVKRNYENASYSENSATFDFLNLDLTGGSLYCDITRVVGSGATETVYVNANPDVSKIILFKYFVVGNEIVLMSQSVNSVSTEGEYAFPNVTLNTAGKTLLVAYGIKENTELAQARYSEMSVPENVTALIAVTRNLSSVDVTLTTTATKMINPPANQQNADTNREFESDGVQTQRKKR